MTPPTLSTDNIDYISHYDYVIPEVSEFKPGDNLKEYLDREDRVEEQIQEYINNLYQEIELSNERIQMQVRESQEKCDILIKQCNNKAKDRSFIYILGYRFELIINNLWISLVDLKTKTVYALHILQKKPREFINYYEASPKLQKTTQLIIYIVGICGLVAVSQIFVENMR
jgi:hypothetical protein